MSTLFLINPGSGRKRNAKQADKLIRDIYDQAGRTVCTEEINFEDLDGQLHRAIENGIQHIFAVGGDGTVNAIGARLIGKPINFGIIPNGSGNGYARNLGYSVNTKLAIRQSLDAQAKCFDTGLFNGLPFLNVAGVGLDAEVAHHFSLGKHRGLGPYVKSAAESLLQTQGHAYQLTIDGEIHEFEELIGVAIANGTQWGYDAKLNPHASLSDGFLDLMIVRKFPLVKVGLIVSKIFSGRFPDSNYVTIFRAKDIRIERQEAGPAQIDGEPFEAGQHIHVKIEEQSLNVLLPNTLTEEKIQSL